MSRLLPRFIQKNNIAELKAASKATSEAASEAIRIALRLGIKRLTIVTDSEHVVKYHEKLTGHDPYKLACFMNSNMYLNYTSSYEQFARLIKRRDVLVEFNQVKGHSAVLGNVEADRLASLALIKAGLKRQPN